MKSDIVIIGGGASGLMAAYGAARKAVDRDMAAIVTVLEKMPRPGRKIMITGKGRCNFTNLKDWNDFSTHIRSGADFAGPAFFNLTPEKTIEFFESFGMRTSVERGDRVFPKSYYASDVVDALVTACFSLGVKIETDSEVATVERKGDGFAVTCRDGRRYICRKLIIATGGLSYPSSGSTGDGYRWARETGHDIVPCFPSLTALVPAGYKLNPGEEDSRLDSRAGEESGTEPAAEASSTEESSEPSPELAAEALAKDDATDSPVMEVDTSEQSSEPSGPQGERQQEGRPSVSQADPQERFHIRRSAPLSEMGEALCGIMLENVSLSLIVQGEVVEEGLGDLEFTDGGLEGPLGFQVSRKAVKALIGGSKVSVVLDLKPGIPLDELLVRLKSLWKEICMDPRNRRLRERDRLRILLGKLMPRALIYGFLSCHPEVSTVERVGYNMTKVWVDLAALAAALKSWKMDIVGYVGYERCVVTAGGVSTSEVVPKTMESRVCKGLYFCGEVLDMDSDTGGYNLQTAFSTGRLAGESAAAAL